LLAEQRMVKQQVMQFAGHRRGELAHHAVLHLPICSGCRASRNTPRASVARPSSCVSSPRITSYSAACATFSPGIIHTFSATPRTDH
jgi:hypothetical protein